jgi:predicted amidohydrolase YtcJ
MQLFTNGNIYNANHQKVDKLWVDAPELSQLQATPYDLQGGTLIPSFADHHIHIWKVGSLLTHILDVRWCTNMAAIQTKIADFAQKNPHHKWIIARGFNENNFEDKQLPTAAQLSEAVPDRPVFLQRTCAHIAVINHKALEICKITAQTTPPQGGVIGYDTAAQPSGVLYETAMSFATQHFAHYTHTDYVQMVQAAQNQLLSYGITHATDPAVMPDLLQSYKQMNHDNQLKIHTEAIAIHLPDGETQPLPLPEYYHEKKLKVQAIKFFADGGLSGKTAAVHHAYNNDPNNKGILRLDAKQFGALAQNAHDQHLQIATHAIGDRAIDLVLDVYEKILRHSKRHIAHRIEHLGLPHPHHLQKIKALGIIVVSQPIFITELGNNFIDYLPKQYLPHCYPYKNILDSGIPLWLSTDAPVVQNLNPFVGIQAAILRQTHTQATIAPDQSITLSQAMQAYTINSKGYMIVDKNPYTTPIDQLHTIKVQRVFVQS